MVPFRIAVTPEARAASGRRSNVPRNGTPAMQAGFVAERRGAPPGELRQLLAVRRDQRLVRRHDRDAAIERAAHQRIRRLDAAERLDDDVDRFGEEGVGIVGDRRDEVRGGARMRRAADQGGGDDGREPARGQMGGGLTRVAREGGADVTEAEEADPARGRDASRGSIDDGCGRRRRVEHDRSHDERSVGCATAIHAYRGNDPAVKSMRASGRP